MLLHGDGKTEIKTNAAKTMELGAGENGVHILETTQCGKCGIEGLSGGITMAKVEFFKLMGSNGGHN